MQRTLTVDVVHNIRHLGGHPTASGRVTCASDLVRSAGLMKLENAGMDALVMAGVRTIVDLRSSAECEEAPTPDVSAHRISRIHAPVFERDASPAGLSDDEADEPVFPGYAVVYQRFLETGRNAYRTLFETIARSDDGVLYHCAAGKDRTGVATMLLLDLAGVPEADIVADYHRTEQDLAPMRELWEPRMRERGMSQERIDAVLGAPETEMWATLEHLRGRWGSAAGYLTDLGLSDSEISTIRARLRG